MTWHEDASCVGTVVNMTDPSGPYERATALLICTGCPVRAECLEEALADEFSTGVWGGTTTAQREKLRKDRRRPGAVTASCGSLSAYRRHYKRGEKPCDICRDAASEGYRRRSQGPQPHGTNTAYDRHRSHGEAPCDPCAEAHRQYLAARRAS